MSRLNAAWRWLAARPPRELLLGGWVIFVLGCFPGYLSYASAMQLTEVRSGVYTDAHPAVMTALWGLVEYVAAGPFPMLVLQSGLALFGLAAVLRTRLSPRAAAVTAVALVLFPPIFAPLAVIWPEPLMTGALLAAAGALLQPSRRWRIAGAVALLVACACHAAAALAIIPIVALAVPGAGLRRIGAIALVCVAAAGAAWSANTLLTDRTTYDPDQALMLADVVGTLRRAKIADPAALGDLATDRERAAAGLVAGHDAFDAWPLVHGPHRLIEPIATAGQDAALRAAWRHVIRAHTGAYLVHRYKLSAALLGLEGAWQPIYDAFGDPALLAVLHHRATPSDWQVGMRAFVRAVGRTPLFRPWLYLLLAIVALALSRGARVERALVASGLIYELATFVVAPTTDYRYSHWLVTATCIAIAARLVARRAAWRAS